MNKKIKHNVNQPTLNGLLSFFFLIEFIKEKTAHTNKTIEIVTLIACGKSLINVFNIQFIIFNIISSLVDKYSINF